MFATIVIPKSSVLDQKLLGCFGLVADDIFTADFYLNSYWVYEDFMKSYVEAGISKYAAEEAILKTLGSRPKKNNSPILGYFRDGHQFDGSTTAGEGFCKVGPELVLSHDNTFHRALLAERRINANTVLLCLAAAGIEITLPSLVFETWDSEEMEILKIKLSEERYMYLEALSTTAAEAMDGLADKNLREVYQWAQNNAVFKIAPLAMKLEQAALKNNAKLLQRAGYKALADSPPVIGAAAVSGGLGGAALATGVEVFKALVAALKGRNQGMAHPQVAYIVKLKSALNNSRK